jgi:peptidoglycan-N-acetylglucosamine deacetylase
MSRPSASRPRRARTTKRRPAPRRGFSPPWLILFGLAALVVSITTVRFLGSTGSPTSAEPAEPPDLSTPAPQAAAPTRIVPTPPRATPTSLSSGPTKPSPTTAPTPTSAARPAAPTPTPVVASTATPVPTPPPVLIPTNEPRPVTGKVVALTFDAGSDRGYADDILDILQQEHISASFGITATWAKANPDLVRRMAAEGHLVINHTVDHRSFTGLSDKLGGLTPAKRRAELEDADAVIAPLLGHSTKPWYRLPYGDDDAHVASDVASAGYTRKVGWTVDSLGWRGVAAADIGARCLKLAAPSAIYVMHVGRASQDALALPRVVAGLREQGYGFVGVDAL